MHAVQEVMTLKYKMYRIFFPSLFNSDRFWYLTCIVFYLIWLVQTETDEQMNKPQQGSKFRG